MKLNAQRFLSAKSFQLKFSPFSIIIYFVLIFPLHNSYSQEVDILSIDDQKKIINTICEKLEEIHAFPEYNLEICNGLLKNFEDAKYTAYTTLQTFADQLDEDLEILRGDKHLGIFYDSKMAADMESQNEEGEDAGYLTPQMIEEERKRNFGFKELKIMPGNIGYMDLRIFFPPKYAGETAVASMNYLSNCDALIIDLRNNGGGWDEMVTFLMSYFFDNDESVTLSTTYSRYEDEYYQSNIFSYVPGNLLFNIPVFILTSRSTFSGAEAFAHYMKHFNKATLVGETTRGGQNPVEIQAVGYGLIMLIPSWKQLSSVSEVGWEGVGVTPHIEVDVNDAIQVAHLKALEELIQNVEGKKEKSRYIWIVDGLNATGNPVSVDESILKSYAGKYGIITIYYEKGDLYYQYGDRSKMLMIPMSENYFMVDVYDHLRVKFLVENNSTVGIEQIYDDGRIKKYDRD
jgi:hypothetical protein